MTTTTAAVQWELDLPDIDPAFGAEFGLENRDDFDAINRAVEDIPRKLNLLVAKGSMTKAYQQKMLELIKEWRKFYTYVIQSWYVSDEDLNLAKKKRDDLFTLVYPKESALVKTFSKGDVAKGSALTKEEAEAYDAETKSFLQRNWIPISLVVVVLGAGVYFGGSALAFLQVAKRHKIAKAVI